jgi:hypothetical protein
LVLRVDLGVGGTVIVSGSRAVPSQSYDGWVGDLGVIVIWVGTWDRGFNYGVSDFCFSFKNTSRVSSTPTLIYKSSL